MQISEHPFGTIKHYDDGRSLPLQSKEMVAADCSISALAYNIRRAINLCGSVQNLIDCYRRKAMPKTRKIMEIRGPLSLSKSHIARSQRGFLCDKKAEKKQAQPLVDGQLLQM